MIYKEGAHSAIPSLSLAGRDVYRRENSKNGRVGVGGGWQTSSQAHHHSGGSHSKSGGGTR